MEVQAALARCEVNLNLCIICQKRKSVSDATTTIGERGLVTLKEAILRRKQLLDETNAAAIARLESVLQDDGNPKIRYHRHCYSTFANSNRIGRLESSQAAVNKNVADPKSTRQNRQLSRVKVNWEQCIFCQTEMKETTHQVMSFNRNDCIVELASVDFELSVRIAGITDLIAAEAKYHSSCLRQCQRLAAGSNEENKRHGVKHVSFVELCHR